MALSIGLFGASRIAPVSLVAPARETGLVVPIAVAARSLDRARKFARDHGIAQAVVGYDTLLALPGLDAIYNGLPTSLHARHSIDALASGRHVLCEKPFAMNAIEARAMVAEASARDLILMEAFHYRYHPMIAMILESIAAGAIGDVLDIEAVFDAEVPEAAREIRYDHALGGGALMDLGTYCIHWCRTIAASEPVVVWAEHVRATTGVDRAARAALMFPNGVSARLSCSMVAPFRATLTIRGEHGVIRATNPLVPQYGARLELERAGTTVTIPVPSMSTYGCQLVAFVEAIRGRATPLTGGADAIAQMETLDAIRAVSEAVSRTAFNRSRG